MARVINIDIDTTGLPPVKYHDICRIVAFDNEEGFTDDNFSLFVMPECEISEEVSELNKITVRESQRGRQLLFNGRCVEAIEQKDALRRLYRYILAMRRGGQCVLISHYSEKFLCPFLLNGFLKHLNISPAKIDEKGIKFADSWSMMRRFVPDQKSLALLAVYKSLFPEEKPYATPNAENDCKALKAVLDKLKIDTSQITAQSFRATDVDIDIAN